MTHRLPTFLTLASLVLCTVVVVSWVDSYLPERFHLRSHRGRILFVFAAARHGRMFDPYSGYPGDLVVQNVRILTAPPDGVHLQFGAFEAALSDRDTGFWFFAVPHWAVALPLAVAAGLGMRAEHVRRRRRLVGACARCGYDLRQSPGRCPECGTMPPGAPAP